MGLGHEGKEREKQPTTPRGRVSPIPKTYTSSGRFFPLTFQCLRFVQNSHNRWIHPNPTFLPHISLPTNPLGRQPPAAHTAPTPPTPTRLRRLLPLAGVAAGCCTRHHVLAARRRQLRRCRVRVTTALPAARPPAPRPRRLLLLARAAARRRHARAAPPLRARLAIAPPGASVGEDEDSIFFQY